MANENADNINSTDAAGNAGAEEVQVQLIDGVCVVTTNDISSTLTSPIVVEKPAAGQTAEIDVIGGQKYLFDFSENNVESFIQDGDDLTLSFADGSSILLLGFGTAAASSIPSTLAFTGDLTADQLQQLIQVVSSEPAIEALEIIENEPQAEVRGEETQEANAGETESEGEGDNGAQQLAAVEPAAGEEINPEDLAQIEPAAGDAATGAGAADAGGAGFQSSFTPQGVIPIEDVGPIGPTALQYQIPEFREDIFAQEQDDSPELLSPAALNLDETNLGPLSLSGTVNVDFGNDGPGTIAPDGSFTSGGSQTGGTLSSNGNLIDVTPTADGYVGTINGGADTVFEITINPNTGVFEFTQFLAIDHADGTNPDDIITLNFGVVATDADGDAANTSITVNIADDAPAAVAPDENTINEQALTGGPIVVTDTLVVDFGNDGPGAVSPNGSTDVTGVATLTSGGAAITITQTADGYIGTLPGGAVAFELVIDPTNGNYEYTQNVAIDHNPANDTISLEFGVNVTDFDTDSTATTITININDSVPEIKDDQPEVGKGIENVDETFLPGGSTASGSLDVDFGADVPGQIVPDGNTTVTGSVAGGSLTSNGNDVTITQTADGYVGTINGGADTVFTFTIDPSNGDYTFDQLLPIDHADGTDANDVITITFGVEAQDADGDSDSGSVTINIADDGPQVSDSTAPTINENTVDTAPITVNGSVNPDFGSDGPGDVQPNGTTSVNGVATLSSNGEAITVTQTATGYVGTLTGGGTAFELTVNPATGAYEFTQFVALDHEAGNDIITLNFGVTGTDFDTDTDTATISINIKDSVPEINDKPKLGDGLEVVDETDLPGVTTSGQLTVDFGSDLPGTVTANDTFNSGGSQLGGNLTSNGVPVVVNLVGDTYVGTAGTDTIFTLQVNTDGSYTFELIGTLDHADPNDPNDIIDLEFGVTATDGDGDTDSTTIIVKVKDDVPVIGDAAGDVDESNFDNGPLSTSDTIFTSFGTEVGSIAPDGNAVAEANGNPIALTSNGDAVTITQTADGYVGTTNGGGTTIFTITVDPLTGQYTYTQFETLDHPDGTDPNDTIELSFGVAVTSTDGDSDTGTITISVGDDGPVANDEFSGAEEGQLITGNLLTNDELSQDADNTVTNVRFDGTDYPITAGGSVTITTTLGEITVNSDGTYTYTATDLGDPDGTDLFTYTLTDGDGDSDTAQLSVRVTPDGEPVAVTEEMTVDETNLTPGPLVINESIALDFGLDGAGTFDPNGDFQFGGSALGGDLTSGGQPVEVTQTTDGYIGVIQGTTTTVFELSVQDNGDYTFQLFNTLDHADATDPNDTIVLDFGVTLTDIDGDTADGTITINVLDDAPVAFDDANTVPENQLTASGNVTNNDIDGEDAPSNVTNISFGGGTPVAVVAGTATTINGQYGTLEINADGTYTYTSFGTNTTAVQDVFTYSLTDFDGDTDTAELTINITDIDVKPEVVGSEVTVDETDLNPTDDASNTVTANFGVDGPGTITVSGANTFTFDGAENNALTSNGVPVTVTTQGNSYVGTAGTETIFTLDLDQDTGDYTFTLIGTLDHADETDPDDVIELTFGVTATDSDGDIETGTIKVNVKDDGPSISGKAAPIDEDGLVNGPISYTRTLNHDYGEDGAGEIRPTDTFMATFEMGGNAQTLTSGGEAIIVTQTANGYIGQTAGGETIFTLNVQNNGQYTYTQFAGIDHPDPNDGDDVIWLKFGVEIVDYDGDTAPATIVVDVHDAMPTAPNNSVFPVAEHGLENGPVVVTKNFNGGDFGGDGEGQYEFDGTFMLAGNSSTAGNELTSNGETINVTFNGNIATGTTAGGTVVFTMEIDPATGQHTFTLFEALDHGKTDKSGAQDVVWAKFGVNIVDADGDSKPAMIQVDIRDDAPDAVDDVNTLADNQASVDGNVIPNDDLSADDPNTVTKISFGGTTKDVVAGTATEIDGQYGKLSINADGTYTYTSFGTNTAVVQDVFTYTLTDFDGDFDLATLTITLQDIDDKPIIADVQPLIVDETDLNPTDDDSNVITADFGDDAPGTFSVTGTGTFSFNGAENNQLTSNGVQVDVTVDGNDYVGTAGGAEIFRLSLNANTGEYEFTLSGTLDHADETNPDDIIELTFGVTATDSDGDTDTGSIVVQVKDDGPSIQGKAAPIDEDGLVNGPISYTRTLNHDYGEDGAGEIRPTDTFMATYSMGGNAQTITSDGVPVDIQTTANGYVGTANGQTIFTLDVQTNGQYTYTQYAGLDHPDTNNDDDVMWLKFGVEIVDFDGDTAPATITVDVHDAAPTAPNNSVFPVAEHGLENGPVVVMRNFNGGDFGGDGEGQYEYNGTFMLLGNSSTATDELTSGGEKVEVTFNGNVATGTTVGGLVVFTMELDPATGKHTFTLFEPLDHGKPDASGAQDVVWAKFGVDIVDADGDRESAMIQVDIRDDAPEAGANSVFPVSEAGLVHGPVEVTRDLDGDFHADGAGQYEYNGTFMLLGNSSTATDELTSGGDKVEVTFNGNVATGTTTGGTVVFTMELDPATGEHTFTLFEPLDHGKPDASGAQDVVWAKFGVDIVDADGDRDSTMIQVDIRDAAPTAHDDCNEFEVEVVNKDFNIVMALDVSGSMSGDKIALLKSSVNNLLSDFSDYQYGEIKVHLVPFATYAGAGETFTVTDQDGFDAALAYINGLSANGTTNYEAPLQSAIDWLNGASANDPIAGADTYTYFVSDGAPNRYMNASGQLAAGDAATVMGEITGSDGSNEVETLQNLSTEVIGVGIGVDGATIARLGQIDSDGTALDVQDPTDLEAALQSTNPVKGSTSGNVITGENGGPDAADKSSPDVANTVTQIRFGGTTLDVPADGSNVSIVGQYGELTINNTGEYSYDLFDGAYTSETSYVFTKFNPPGSDNGGDIKKVQANYNETTESLSFEMVIDPVSEGFTLALNNGPNPKGHGGELALIYFDASGTDPVITVYAYNGANTQTSYKDGSAAGGTQAPDKILSSLTDPGAFDITVTTDANGNKVFSFEMDASSIQSHDPAYGPNGDWSGVSFDDAIGIWLHPVKNLDTEYNSDGFLSNWSGSQGYYDTSNQHAVKHTTTEGSTSDQFEYVLTDGDGDSDVATLTLKSTASDSSVFTGSDYADVIEGTDEGDVIIGGAGNDVLYGGSGADTFLYESINDGVDTIKDFNAAEGDQFDVSALIQGFDALQDSIDDFVFTNEDNGNTEVFVDQTGSGNVANATQIAVLEAVTGLSAEDIVGDNNGQTTV